MKGHYPPSPQNLTLNAHPKLKTYNITNEYLFDNDSTEQKSSNKS